ncbi:MAG: glucose-6-phosphate isomerase, partial [bacterium]|nr:glucose-6-phosphate isomerase [bacterium]
KGQTPIFSIGTKDQHSQLQLYLDGIKDKCIAFLYIKKHPMVKIPKYENKFPFEGAPLSKAFNALLYGTKIATKERAIPIIDIEINRLNEYALGRLILCFMVATVYFCYAIGVNPFDQPAVEVGKKYANRYLQK